MTLIIIVIVLNLACIAWLLALLPSEPFFRGLYFFALGLNVFAVLFNLGRLLQ